jgi:hypothetical protein
MRIDLYTKAVLTVIAIMLSVIASNQLAARASRALRGRLPAYSFTPLAPRHFSTPARWKSGFTLPLKGAFDKNCD